jgi:hypothetical protein
MWDSAVVEQYDEGISEDSRRVDIDGLEEARCAALVQSARFLEGIKLLTVKIRQPSHEFTFGVGISFIPYPLVLTPMV